MTNRLLGRRDFAMIIDTADAVAGRGVVVGGGGRFRSGRRRWVVVVTAAAIPVVVAAVAYLLVGEPRSRGRGAVDGRVACCGSC